MGVREALAVSRHLVWGSTGYAGMHITYFEVRESRVVDAEWKYSSSEVTARASKRL